MSSAAAPKPSRRKVKSRGGRGGEAKQAKPVPQSRRSFSRRLTPIDGGQVSMPAPTTSTGGRVKALLVLNVQVRTRYNSFVLIWCSLWTVVGVGRSRFDSSPHATRVLATHTRASHTGLASLVVRLTHSPVASNGAAHRTIFSLEGPCLSPMRRACAPSLRGCDARRASTSPLLWDLLIWSRTCALQPMRDVCARVHDTYPVMSQHI